MATYYSSHNAGGSGVGSIGDPFTLEELVDTVTNADLGLVMATGIYLIPSQINFDINSSSPIIIRGANADGSDDGTTAVISGANLPAGHDIFEFNLTSLWVLSNFRLTESKARGIRETAASISPQIILHNVEIDNSVNDGVYFYRPGSNLWAFNCSFHHNVNGLTGASNARGGFYLTRCAVYHNTSAGINDRKGGRLIDCLVYRNLNSGAVYSGNDWCEIFGTVFAFNTNDGLNFSSGTGRVILENSIFRSNGGYGINTNTGGIHAFFSARNNCSNNNTSGHIDINGGTLPGTDNITSDPKFVNEGDGTEDFALQSDSPCLAAGIDSGIW